MERSPVCPTCISKYDDIKGMVYGPGEVSGHQCTDSWHLGCNYDPNRWVLSPFDFEFLEEQHVSSR